MEILEKLMDIALDFKHTRQVVFEFESYEEEGLLKKLIFNCRKREVKEISMWEISDNYKKEKYFLTEKMIDDDIVNSFLKYSSYKGEYLLLNKAYYKDSNGNNRQLYDIKTIEMEEF